MQRDAGDPYTYPGSDVLRNKLGIRDQGALAKVEYEVSKARLGELREKPIKGQFDLAHLKAIHAHVFHDVYAWAGEVRTVDISKDRAHFARAPYIESEGKRLCAELAREGHLKGLDKPQFVERLAHHYGELNALHPFREGNGRSTREFLGQLAREAGYELDQTRIDNSKGRWNQAAMQSLHGDLEPIKQIFAESIRPSRAVDFEKLPETEALKKHPELAPAYGYMRALDAKAEADGLNVQQREVVMGRVRENVAARIEGGDIPSVAIRDVKQVVTERGPER